MTANSRHGRSFGLLLGDGSVPRPTRSTPASGEPRHDRGGGGRRRLVLKTATGLASLSSRGMSGARSAAYRRSFGQCYGGSRPAGVIRDSHVSPNLCSRGARGDEDPPRSNFRDGLARPRTASARRQTIVVLTGRPPPGARSPRRGSSARPRRPGSSTAPATSCIRRGNARRRRDVARRGWPARSRTSAAAGSDA